MIWKAEEWQSLSGRWYCNCIDNLAGDSGEWYMPARILNISPADFIRLLIKDFKPDHIDVYPETCFISYSWDSQVKERLFKNFINRKAREVNFQI